VYIVTRTQRQFLLRPDREATNAFICCLALAAQRTWLTRRLLRFCKPGGTRCSTRKRRTRSWRLSIAYRRYGGALSVCGSDDPLEVEQLEDRASEGSAALSSVAPMPQIVSNKSRLSAELVGAGWNCLMTGVAAVTTVAGV